MFLSAKDSEREIKYGYKLGANFYLTKPFPPERLLKSLEMLLQPLGAPRHKSFSLREIELRRKTKLDVAVHAVNAVSDVLSHAVASSRGHSLTPSPESVETPETPQSGFKLKRLLAKMDPEPDSEKWVG